MKKTLEKAVLTLADGKTYQGYAFGNVADFTEPVWGEVVFNTSIFGYQEIITDPSYAGQIMSFTNPHIGNVGCNSMDVESHDVHVTGVVIRNLTNSTSNYRAQMTFEEYLKQNNKVGLCGIDTRELVRYLRDNGSQLGAISLGDAAKASTLTDFLKSKDYADVNFVEQVSCTDPYQWSELPWDHKGNYYPKLDSTKLNSRPHVVAIDCGIKFNILRLLTATGFRVTVVPSTYGSERIAALKPDGVFISNGPGDPSKLPFLVKTTKELLEKYPMFGICLGHQLIGQAIGGSTFKLKFGHRGGNHPVRFETNKVIEISVQNHGYAVSPEGLPKDAVVSHVNLNDGTVEGLELPKQRAFSVQYHPESSPGPHDSQYLFQRFYDLVTNAQTN